MFLPGALHGIEASFLADIGLRKFRAAIVRVVWSRRQSLANPGAVPGFTGFWSMLLLGALVMVLFNCLL